MWDPESWFCLNSTCRRPSLRGDTCMFLLTCLSCHQNQEPWRQGPPGTRRPQRPARLRLSPLPSSSGQGPESQGPAGHQYGAKQMTRDPIKMLIFVAARGGPATAHRGSTETSCRRQDRAAVKGQRSRTCEGRMRSRSPEPRAGPGRVRGAQGTRQKKRMMQTGVFFFLQK